MADATTTTNFNAAQGKVGIINGTTALSACPAAGTTSGTYVDMIGYGTTSSTCHEGTGNAPAPSATMADVRANLAVDNVNNATDYTLAAPNPHNSSYVATTSTALAASGSANPSSVVAGNTTTLSVSVTPGSTSTGITVVADLSSIGGSATTNIPSTATNTFSTTVTVTTSSSGSISLPVKVTDQQGGVVNTTIALTVSQPPPVLAIDVIQGHRSTTSQSLSPYINQRVTTSGVVTAVIYNGFFMQTPDAQKDNDVTTPEGIEVYTGTAPTVSVGNIVSVTGIPQPYPATSASHTPATEMTSSVITVTNSTNTLLPAPIPLTTSMLTPTGGLYQLTPYESMRVSIPSLTSTSGTGGTLTENTETEVSNGVFYAIMTGTYGNSGQTRPFREPGIDLRDSFSPKPTNALVFDDNPERILVDTLIGGRTAIDVSSGAVLPNVTGVLDFTYSSDSFYDPSRLIVDTTYDATQVTAGMTVQPVPAKAANEYTVASFNIERFYNTDHSDDTYAVPPGVSCFSGDISKGTNLCTSEAVDVTQTAYMNRLKKLSVAIRTVLNSPDIVTLEEVENQSVANDIATQLNTDAGVSNLYTALSTDNSTYYGQDGTGISVGFLVKNTVDKLGFSQFGQNTSFTPSTGGKTTLNDRPWLILNAGIPRGTGTKDYPITVIVNHLKALSGINSTTTNSTRLKKELQAEAIAGYINTAQANGQHVISGGDFNAFEFSDGYTDTLATYTNVNVRPSNEVVQPGVAGLVNPSLTDLALTLPAPQRWSYVEDGSAQILDHIVVTPDLVSTGIRFAYAHLDADFPLISYNDPTIPDRASDHDAAVGYFILPAPVLAATLTPGSTDFGSVIVGNTTSGQQFTLTNTGEGPVTVSGVATTGDFAASSNCTTVAINSSCAINVTFMPTTTGARTGTLTVTTNTGTVTYTSTLTGMGTGATVQTITFPQPQQGITGTSATLTATSSSNLAVIYSVTSGPATVSGSTITYTGAGTVVIAANQPGDATYAGATTVSVSVAVVTDYVWAVNTTGSVDKYVNSGALISGPAGTAATASSFGGIAFDASGTAWSVTSANNTLNFENSGASAGSTVTGGGVSTPMAVAVDGAGQIWLTDGSGSISEFSNTGIALSPATGYTGVTTSTTSMSTYFSPTGLAIDLSGNVWVSNSTANTVTEILGAAAPAAPLATAVTNNTTGVRP